MLTFSSHRLLKVQGSGDLTVFTLKLHSFLLTVRMLFHCVVARFQYYIYFEAIQSKFCKLFGLNFRSYSQYNHMKFRGISDEIQMDFRGSQMVFKGLSGDFQLNFRWISEQFQGVLTFFSGNFQYL